MKAPGHRAEMDEKRYKLQALTNALREFQKSPPLDDVGMAQYEDMFAEYNKLLGITGRKRQPAVPVQAPAAAQDTRNLWDRLWNNQPEESAPVAPPPVGFKATKLSREELNKLRAKIPGLKPI